MPTKREVWLAADALRERSQTVSVRSVRAALQYGGSYRDIGPHLADWKAERSYTRVIEVAGLPEHIQTQLARAGTTLWQAALQDATKFLSAEREQARAVAKVDQEIRDEALAAADVLEARVWHLQAEIERLKSELATSQKQSAAFLAKLMELRGDPADPDGVRQRSAGDRASSGNLPKGAFWRCSMLSLKARQDSPPPKSRPGCRMMWCSELLSRASFSPRAICPSACVRATIEGVSSAKSAIAISR